LAAGGICVKVELKPEPEQHKHFNAASNDNERERAMQRLAAVLREDVCRQIEEIGAADVLVGIPSFNNARTIGHVVRAAQAGLGKYFPACRAVLVNSDGGSTDETMNTVRQASVDFNAVLVQNQAQPLHKILTP